jgi:hypothetical protein
MNSQTLKKLALYVLQALLWIGAIMTGVAIFGGMCYLHEASKHDYAAARSAIFSILKNEIILAALGASFLVRIGTVRTHIARCGTEQRKRTISLSR